MRPDKAGRIKGCSRLQYRKTTKVEGNVTVTNIAPDWGRKNKGRGKKQITDEKTREKNKNRNRRQRAKKLAATLNCNFSAGDFHIVLTARPNARAQVADENAVRNFIRRLQYAEGRKLKYVWVQEHHDSNVHYHLIIEKCKYRNIKKSWPFGWANIEKLADDDKIELAVYLAKEADSYHAARGMKQPQITEQVTMTAVEAQREMADGTFAQYNGWLGIQVAEKRQM